MATILLFCLLGTLVVYLLLETWLHNRRWRRVPIRIHLNGTRGKSSTTRLIAAGLRSTGKTVVAKTTGTTARVILPNGRELPLFRPLGANIREQFRVLRLASKLRAKVLVIECMALQPELQWLSERWFVHATHGVVTNCRPDHLDVMGPTRADVARALAGSLPRGGVAFTGEPEFLGVLKEASRDRGTELVEVGSDDVDSIGSRELEGFRHAEHPQNVAIALRVCERLGANREAALRAMWEATPDAGAQYVMRMQFFGRDIIFVNGFAANDPESSRETWAGAIRAHGAGRRHLALLNTRADRADRSRQHAETIREWNDLDHILVMGTGTAIFSRTAVRNGLDGTRLSLAEGAEARDVLEKLVSFAQDGPLLVVGLCNIGGEGLKLVELIRNRSRLVRPEEDEAA